MMTQQTRRESHGKVDKATRYQQILGVLNRPMTAREVMQALGYTDMNTVRPRLTELCALRRIKETGLKFDPATNRRVTVFERSKQDE